MISISTGIRPEQVRHQGQHVLFVEGNDENSVDPNVLNELFDQGIRIEPLGPSYSIQSVAQALYTHHPTYYFLIDRDHHKDDFVDHCWSNFPDPESHNLLIWRRREIENYFLEPDYLFQSKYCCVGKDELESRILQCVNERLFLDTANHVVITIREEIKRNWIKIFSNPADFSDKESALLKLKNANEFEQHSKNVEEKVSSEEVERRFHYYLEIMTGGEKDVTLGIGEWLHMVKGKKILAQIVNSGCFRVQDVDGKPIEAREQINAIVKDLLQKNTSILPADFVALKELIDTRINGSI